MGDNGCVNERTDVTVHTGFSVHHQTMVHQ
jgi:hypothetical protein